MSPRSPIARTRTRRVVAVLLAAATIGLSSTVNAQSSESPAARAAREIQDARDRANAAAQAMFDKESEIDRLELDIAETEKELAAVEARADEMRDGLEAQAVRQFVGAGGPDFPLFIDLDETNDVLAADVLASVAANTAVADLDEFDAVMTDVEETREELALQQQEAESAVDAFAALQVAAEEEVVRLGEIEKQRLIDEAVQQELERQQRIRDEQERQEREAAAAAASASASASAAASATPGQAASARSAGSGSASAQVAPTPAPANAGSGLVCPIAGPRSYADTWGAARSGGRRHEGTDIMSPSGTPLVAMEAGRVEYRSNRLGGRTLRLYGAGGTRYYYAHLSRYEGSNRSVSAGDVVGYVGKTGNTSANHLHLQVHPGGGRAVNPYPYVRRACG
jgi:murein DD-endopeptidase MepM/ murein hydrolase activator NlpD